MNADQLKAILWLRWRITRNQWQRQGGIGAVIAVFVGLGALAIGALTFLGGLFGAAAGLGRASPSVIWVVWLSVTLGFLFWWMVGLLYELQRSETIDLQRLMHLPVALAPIFVINYLASHLSLSVVVFVPAMLGLALGLTISRSLAMFLLVPLAIGMVLMITAWTYYLRGWLATMMTNPRRRRAIVMALTLGLVLIFQAPNIYFNFVGRDARYSQRTGTTADVRHQRAARRRADLERMKETFLVAQTAIPPLWLPAGALALAGGRPLPALLGALGCAAIGGLGLLRAYRATVRFYQSDSGSKLKDVPKPSRAGTGVALSARSSARFVEYRLPFMPEQAGALAVASFRSLVRAPEVKMAWATTLLLPLIGAVVLLRSASNAPAEAKPFIATAFAAVSIFLLVQFLTNQFGFDRDGFRALVLSPASRQDILLGKNVACLPLCLGANLLLVTAVSIWLRLPPLAFVAALFQLATLAILACLAGNALSILFPYRVNPGSLKPTKMPGESILVLAFFQLFFPLVMTPVFVPPLAELLWRQMGLPSVVPVNLFLSVGLAVLVALLYWRTLGSFGRLLQRRETKILDAITAQVE